MDIKSLIRVGSVSSVNPANGTARVAFEANDDNVTYELPVLTRGSKANKDYWIPDIDEQVVCLFLPNTSGRGVCQGFILGTFYSRTGALSMGRASAASTTATRTIFLQAGSGPIAIASAERPTI